MTGDNSSGSGDATVAYDSGTGKPLWVSRYKGGADLWALAVSPDGTALYVTGRGRGSGRNLEFATIAYAAATGKQRWLRYYTTVKPASGASVAVSPDGKTVYATGSDGSYALTVAYQATRHPDVGYPVQGPLRRLCLRLSYRGRTRRWRRLRRRQRCE